MELTSKLLVFLAGVISTAFGAGVTFAIWNGSHPTEVRVAEMLSETKIDAKEARRSAMSISEDLKGLREDLSRGFGRAYAPRPQLRDDFGKRAVLQYTRLVQSGIAPDKAMRAIIEESLTPVQE